MKVDIGSGPAPLPGYTTVDLYDRNADIRADIRGLVLEDVEHVNASHVLEHLPHVDVIPTLANIHDWMRRNGKITAEVPDMGRITPEHPLWLVYVYGCQKDAGEYHRGGFTESTLVAALEFAGWRDVEVRAFLSEHPSRTGMPCLEAQARA